MAKAAQKPLTAFVSSAFALMLIFGDFSSFQEADVPDIRKFYAAREIIWTVNTTKLIPEYCKVDYVNLTSQKYAFFERDYNLSGTKVKENLAGMYTRMSSSMTFNGMRVFHQNETSFSSYEQLLYVYQDNKCGIFNVTLLLRSTDTFYDIRVKDSAVGHPDSSCVAMFLELCSREHITHITTVYNSSCPRRR
uniref:Putative group i salivary lipocalin n=1 Tax=Rhipicephalus pulchellus TaxID=72859 RepID=L7LR74_RHIPC